MVNYFLFDVIILAYLYMYRSQYRRYEGEVNVIKGAAMVGAADALFISDVG